MTFPDGSFMLATFDEHGRVTGDVAFHDKDSVQTFNLAQLPRQLKRLEVFDDHMAGDIKDLPPSLEVLKMPKSTKLTGDLKDLNFPNLIYINLRRNKQITGDLGDLHPGLRNSKRAGRGSTRSPRSSNTSTSIGMRRSRGSCQIFAHRGGPRLFAFRALAWVLSSCSTCLE